MHTQSLIHRAASHGDRIAIHDATGEFTYRDLLSRSKSIASALLDGTSDLNESRVAYLVSPGFQYTSTQWGIWRAGGVATPLSLSATEKELEYALTDSQSTSLVASSKFASKVQLLCDRHSIRLILVDEITESVGCNLPAVSPDRRAMILYTSGTTSRPKGVVTTHECIQAQIESLVQAWNWQADDRIPLFLPLHHIHGIINIMSCALWSGARIEAFDRFDQATILQRVSEDAFSVFMAVPTIYVKLIETLESMSDDQYQSVVDGFANMRLMISGSAALPASVHEKWTELTGQHLLERYGMTEIGMALSNPYAGERRPGAVGGPLPGVEIRLQSDDAATVTSEERSGEIQVRGANVFLEYWNRPDATKESFQEGWFRTGDIAVIEKGYFRIMGRSSVDIIKSGGYKLSALEIEASLLDHPDIAECAVVGLPDETWGETVCAAVVTMNGKSILLETLAAWCKDRISHYKIPRRLLVTEQLPRNAMGKVTKPAVKNLF